MMKTSGEKVLVELYGGKNTEALDSLRIRKFKDKVVRCASSVEIQNLHPHWMPDSTTYIEPFTKLNVGCQRMRTVD